MKICCGKNSWLAALLATIATPAMSVPADDGIKAAIAALAAQDAAVLRVGHRLVRAGLPLCTAPGRAAGLTLQRLAQYGTEYRDAVRTLLGIGNEPTVAVVVAGSSADAAGLRAGDRIMRIEGVAPPAAKTSARANFAATDAALTALDAALADGIADLTFQRGDRSFAVKLTAPPACAARFDVRAGRSMGASSDGVYVQVSSDLVADVRGDGELAAVLAHELAHNILRHPQRLKAREAGLKVRATEVAADRLSAYLIDAAGYPSADLLGFWQRWGRAHDFGIFSDRTHPGWRKRVASIEAELARIAALRAAGQPVRPPADLLPR
ncbi:MAG: M48 family metallopeptidase [Pseudomonadota bacterium]